ncbi:Uncharacterized protein TCM_004237 [Theobroma cacao]|uniref:Uncharacterized protein n=1 Tax=Theobroma cacao TaxID=3641 RepID=A0A061DP58_THECC|nr:Uncharacterized protein TCM_004237 [Theobroma cacao]
MLDFIHKVDKKNHMPAFMFMQIMTQVVWLAVAFLRLCYPPSYHWLSVHLLKDLNETSL